MKEPLISIQLHNRARAYEPGEMLSGECQIDAVSPDDLRALEISVLWYTDGKGDEDLSVHHFERHEQDTSGPLHELRQFSTRLPKSPVSYEGAIIKIRWCVRIRIFLKQGKELFAEQGFLMGKALRQRSLVGRGS